MLSPGFASEPDVPVSVEIVVIVGIRRFRHVPIGESRRVQITSPLCEWSPQAMCHFGPMDIAVKECLVNHRPDRESLRPRK